jgi:hypothetical protein
VPTGQSKSMKEFADDIRIGEGAKAVRFAAQTASLPHPHPSHAFVLFCFSNPPPPVKVWTEADISRCPDGRSCRHTWLTCYCVPSA